MGPYHVPSQTQYASFVLASRGLNKQGINASNCHHYDCVVPVEQDKPTLGTGQRAVRSELPQQIDGTWTYVWSVEDIPATAQMVKDEAYRRIVAIVPEWKQRNLTAQAAQLAKKGEANWTVEEAAAWAAGEALWDQIAAIRAASDTIEAMDPIPSDFAADSYWP